MSEQRGQYTVTPTLPSVPGSPTLSYLSAGYNTISVYWRPPVTDGGSPITGYVVEYATNGATWSRATAPPNLRYLELTGLTGGTMHTVRVRAVNSVGEGVASTGQSISPWAITAPSPPRFVAASLSGNTAVITWNSPVSTNGSPLTGYEVWQSSDGTNFSKIADTGTAVKAGDVVMEFDATEQEYAQEMALSQLAEADQEIVKIRADSETQASQDQLTLLNARFDLRRAELSAISNKALIPANDYAKRQLSLDEAKRRLAQADIDVKSRAETNRATLAVSEARRDRLRLAADRAKQNIESNYGAHPLVTSGDAVIGPAYKARLGSVFGGLNLDENGIPDKVLEQARRAISDPNAPAAIKAKAQAILGGAL